MGDNGRQPVLQGAGDSGDLFLLCHGIAHLNHGYCSHNNTTIVVLHSSTSIRVASMTVGANLLAPMRIQILMRAIVEQCGIGFDCVV